MKRNNPQPELSDVSQIDWARLAAYIDGEGCISIASVRGNKVASRRVMYVNITVSNTDVRLLEWLKLHFGGAINRNSGTKRPANWAVAYSWYVTSRRAAHVLEGALPYFIIKREQAEIALAFQRTILVDRRYGCKGRPAALLAQQDGFRDQLSALKGTSSRRNLPATTTIQ